MSRPASPRDTERGHSPLVVRGRRGTADDPVKVLAAKRAAAAAAAAEEQAASHRPTGSRRAAPEDERAAQPPQLRRAAEEKVQPKPVRHRSATDDYPMTKPAHAGAKAASRRTTADEVRLPLQTSTAPCLWSDSNPRSQPRHVLWSTQLLAVHGGQ